MVTNGKYDSALCVVFTSGHILIYDPKQSNNTSSVFSCECGFSVSEPEDCGTGA